MIVPRSEQTKCYKQRFRITLTHSVWFNKRTGNYVQQCFLIRYKIKRMKYRAIERKFLYCHSLTRSQAYVKAINFIDNLKHTHKIADKDCLLCDINGVY